MNKFFKIFAILFVTALIVLSCTKDDGPSVAPLRDYAEQYAIDIVDIDEYIDTHYMTIDADLNATFTAIPENGTQLSVREQTEYPLQFKMVNRDAVDYKVYYIKLREGDNRNPTALDSVHVAYRGHLAATDVQFDYAQNPLWFELENVVPGWAEILPLFKTGTYDAAEGPDPVNFTGFGIGVMFLPSGLGYFGNTSPSGTIPAYSNLIFTFRLFELRYKDHDRDGILSKDEVATPGDDPLDYDSDGDGFANMYDGDDDGDGMLTRREIMRPKVNPNNANEARTIYPYYGAAEDDPSTPNIDERQGIPRAFTGPIDPITGKKTPLPEDFTDPTRLRRHLDKNSVENYY